MGRPSVNTAVLVTLLLLNYVSGQDDDMLSFYSPFEPKDGSYVNLNEAP